MFVIPFDYRPYNTGNSNLEYEVPVGRYAEIEVAMVSGTALFNGVAFGGVGAKVKAWIMAGDVISFTTGIGTVTYSEYLTIT